MKKEIAIIAAFLIVILLALCIFFCMPKFEARIGNEFVFDKNDIVSICKSAECSGVRSCQESGDIFRCEYAFNIEISQEAAQRYAAITDKLKIVEINGTNYLDEGLSFYNGKTIIGKLKINADTKGKLILQLPISGFGEGKDRESAYNNAVQEMKNYWNVMG